MATITTITGWVVNPNVGSNDSADILIVVSHLNAHSFLAFVTHTLPTFIILPLFTCYIVYRLHIVNASPTHPHIHSRCISDLGVAIESSCGP